MKRCELAAHDWLSRAGPLPEPAEAPAANTWNPRQQPTDSKSRAAAALPCRPRTPVVTCSQPTDADDPSTRRQRTDAAQKTTATMSVRRRASFDSDSEDGFFEGYSLSGDAPSNELPSPCKIRMNGNRRSFSERVDDLLRAKARDESVKEDYQTPKRRRLAPLCAVTPVTPSAPPRKPETRPERCVSVSEPTPMQTTPPPPMGLASLRAALASKGESTAADALLNLN